MNFGGQHRLEIQQNNDYGGGKATQRGLRLVVYEFISRELRWIILKCKLICLFLHLFFHIRLINKINVVVVLLPPLLHIQQNLRAHFMFGFIWQEVQCARYSESFMAVTIGIFINATLKLS